MAVEGLPTVPDVIVNVALFAPAATVADAGTVKVALLFESATTTLEEAVVESVTVQLEVLLLLMPEGTQDKLLTTT